MQRCCRCSKRWAAEVTRSGNDVTLTGGSLSGVEVDCEDFPDGAVALARPVRSRRHLPV